MHVREREREREKDRERERVASINKDNTVLLIVKQFRSQVKTL